MKGSQFLPRSIFKGVNADGSKFTVTEWEFGSIDIFGDGSGFALLMGFFIGVVLLSVVTPICLLISIFGYKGKIPTSSLVGFVGGVYYLFDASKNWLAHKFAIITFGEALTDKFITLTWISLFCFGCIALISILSKGMLFEVGDVKSKRVACFIIGLGCMIGFFSFIFGN